MKVNVTKMKIRFDEFIRFTLWPDAETTRNYLSQMYGCTHQKRIAEELKYGFSFILGRDELKFVLNKETSFNPWISDVSRLVRFYSNGVSLIHLDSGVYAETTLTFPWEKEFAPAMTEAIWRSSFETFEWGADEFARLKQKYSPKLELVLEPTSPNTVINMNYFLKGEDAAPYVNTLTEWAERYSDGNLVKLVIRIDPWKTEKMSFSWAVYVF